uniref:Uncharacterized protein n=1 Tax=Setaria italica TaxID=4555 RepID=K3ZFM8_SETIT
MPRTGGVAVLSPVNYHQPQLASLPCCGYLHQHAVLEQEQNASW